jgi:hypothetical protein
MNKCRRSEDKRGGTTEVKQSLWRRVEGGSLLGRKFKENS